MLLTVLNLNFRVEFFGMCQMRMVVYNVERGKVMSPWWLHTSRAWAAWSLAPSGIMLALSLLALVDERLLNIISWVELGWLLGPPSSSSPLWGRWLQVNCAGCRHRHRHSRLLLTVVASVFG